MVFYFTVQFLLLFYQINVAPLILHFSTISLCRRKTGQMLPIHDISTILLFIATVSQCTKSSSQSPKNIKIRRNGSTSSMPSNVDPLMLTRALGPSDVKVDSTRILLFDRT